MRDTIAKILKTDTTTDLGFAVTYVDSENTTHNYNVFTSSQFRQVAKQMFGKRVYDDWDDETTLAQMITDFLASFTAWKGIRSDTYGRRMYALEQKFNPLENYRSTETREGSMTHGESVTLSFTNRKDTHKDDSFVEKSFNNYEEKEQDDSSTTRTYTDYTETEQDDSATTKTFTDYTETEHDDSSVTRSYTNFNETFTHTVSADDSGTYVPSSQDTKATTGSYADTNGFVQGDVKTIAGSIADTKSFTNGDVKTITGSITDTKGFTVGDKKTISGTIKDQKGFTLGVTDEKAGSETTAHSGTDEDEYTLERFGNIGVTTSQQMLASDLDLLKYDIAMLAIKEFIGQYTFISEEVD